VTQPDPVSDPDRLAKLLPLEEVKQHVAKVLAMDLAGDDPEKAHYEQDKIFVAVLRAIGAGHPQAREMAVEVLRIWDDEHGTRWYT